MKRFYFVFAFMILFASANAQMVNPVTWAYASKKISATEAVVYIKGTIDEGWHVYSQNVKDGGPVKTSFTFAPSKLFTYVGKTIEPKPITKMEKVFGMEVGYFEKSVVFQQKIKLKGKGPVTVKGSFEYMTCDDHQCLPPQTVDFTVAVK